MAPDPQIDEELLDGGEDSDDDGDDDGDELLFPPDVAIELKVDVQTIRRWVRSGKLPSIRMPSGRIRIRRSDIDRILEGDQAAS